VRAFRDDDRRQVAEAPTKPISGVVSHCATQYVVSKAEHVNAVDEGGGLPVSTRLKVVVVGRQAFVLGSGPSAVVKL
jgi:hypothetical protein